jgi:YVTN family beta-propeller protein
VTPDGSKVYIVNNFARTVSVIATATNMVTATIPVGSYPWGVAVTPDGSKVYVANNGANTVSVIDTATNMVTATIPVGDFPFGVAVTPDGSEVYVANNSSENLSVIATGTNAIITTIPVVSGYPVGVFITTCPAGATRNPGSATCICNDKSEGIVNGQCVSETCPPGDGYIINANGFQCIALPPCPAACKYGCLIDNIPPGPIRFICKLPNGKIP